MLTLYSKSVSGSMIENVFLIAYQSSTWKNTAYILQGNIWIQLYTCNSFPLAANSSNIWRTTWGCGSMSTVNQSRLIPIAVEVSEVGTRWGVLSKVCISSLFNCSADVLPFTNAYFGEHSSPDFNFFYCYGNESRLIDCTYFTTTSCSASHVAGVRCQGKTVAGVKLCSVYTLYVNGILTVSLRSSI